LLTATFIHNEKFPAVAVFSQVAMDGDDGTWVVLASIVSASSMNIVVDEDQIADKERKHPYEEVDYIVFSSAGAVKLTSVVLSMESMVVPELADNAWTTVSLSEAYVSRLQSTRLCMWAEACCPPSSA
jgi:hypothetical protein